MEVSLTKDEIICLNLKSLLPIPELCHRIIRFKNDSENKDTYNYHLDRWIKIAGEHYYTRDNHYDKFSYVLDSEEYIVKPDHRLEFYNMTGISYQVLELLYELIKIGNENSWDFEIDDKEDWLRHDDKLYGKLSYLIMDVMKDKN